MYVQNRKLQKSARFALNRYSLTPPSAGFAMSGLRHRRMPPLSLNHRLAGKKLIHPKDIASETLITYPVEAEGLDVFKHFLQPAGLPLENQRTSELTDMIVQHVDSQRGIAVLPDWVLHNHALAKTLTTRSLGKHGVHRTVYAAVRNDDTNNIELKDFIDITPSVIHNLKK